MNNEFMKLAEMTEEDARKMLEGLRWSDGIICPKCGSDKGAYEMKSKPESKNQIRPGLYKCKACRKTFTVTMGTIFEDSHISIKKWMLAIYLMNASKKGISAHQLHRMLDITYKAAWFMAHRIRYAMTEQPLGQLLAGEVELDSTYIGGKEKNKHFKLQTEGAQGGYKKTSVFALVERGGELRARKMKTLSNLNIRDEVRKQVDPSATLMTDEANAYEMLDREYKREFVRHSRKQYVKGKAHTNTLEGWFSLLKRGVTGTFHHVSEQHLDRYVGEFAFRYNNREMPDMERAKKVVRKTEGKRLVYKETIKKNPAS